MKSGSGHPHNSQTTRSNSRAPGSAGGGSKSSNNSIGSVKGVRFSMFSVSSLQVPRPRAHSLEIDDVSVDENQGDDDTDWNFMSMEAPSASPTAYLQQDLDRREDSLDDEDDDYSMTAATDSAVRSLVGGGISPTTGGASDNSVRSATQSASSGPQPPSYAFQPVCAKGDGFDERTVTPRDTSVPHSKNGFISSGAYFRQLMRPHVGEAGSGIQFAKECRPVSASDIPLIAEQIWRENAAGNLLTPHILDERGLPTGRVVTQHPALGEKNKHGKPLALNVSMDGGLTGIHGVVRASALRYMLEKKDFDAFRRGSSIDCLKRLPPNDKTTILDVQDNPMRVLGSLELRMIEWQPHFSLLGKVNLMQALAKPWPDNGNVKGSNLKGQALKDAFNCPNTIAGWRAGKLSESNQDNFGQFLVVDFKSNVDIILGSRGICKFKLGDTYMFYLELACLLESANDLRRDLRFGFCNMSARVTLEEATAEQIKICNVIHSDANHCNPRTAMRNKSQLFPGDKSVTTSFLKVFISFCWLCQMRRFVSNRIIAEGGKQSTQSGEPGILFAADLFSVNAKAKEGEPMGFMAITDAHTKAASFSVVKGQTAEDVCVALMSAFAKYPPNIGGFQVVVSQSDGGPAFTANLTKAIQNCLGLSVKFTVAYNSQSNGLAENLGSQARLYLHGILAELCKRWASSKSDLWHLYGISLLERLYMDSYHPVIGVTPRQIVSPAYYYGQTESMALIDARRLASGEFEGTTLEFCEKLEEHANEQQIVLERYREKHLDELRKKNPTATVKPTPGEFLMMRRGDRYRSQDLPLLDIPTILVKVSENQADVGDNFLRIEFVDGAHKDIVQHVAKLARFRYSPMMGLSPTQIAALAENRFAIEIVSHEGSARKRTEMTFRVKFPDFPEAPEETYTWDQVRDQVALNIYIAKTPSLKSLQDKSFVSTAAANPPVRFSMFGPSNSGYIDGVEQMIEPKRGASTYWDQPEQFDDSSNGNLDRFDPTPESLQKRDGHADDNYLLVTIDPTNAFPVSQREEMKKMLKSVAKAFSPLNTMPCNIGDLSYNLRMEMTPENLRRFRQAGYTPKLTVAQLKWFYFHIDKMFEYNMVEEVPIDEGRNCMTLISFNMVSQPKVGKEDHHRLVWNMVQMNNTWLSPESNCEMPDQGAILENLAGKQFMFKMDAAQCFSQFGLVKEQRNLFTFKFRDQFTGEIRYARHTRMVIGANQTPGLVQNSMVQIFGLPENTWLDDMIEGHHTLEQHKSEVKRMCRAAITYNFRLQAPKTFVMCREMEALGRVAGPDGIGLPQAYKLKVENFVLPATVTLLLGFLGVTVWARHHIENYAHKCKPLRVAASEAGTKKGSKVKWNEDMINSFETLKRDVANAFPLSYVDSKRAIFINVDASLMGRGAFLWQLDTPHDFVPTPEELLTVPRKPIRYLSEAHNETQRRWPTVEQEAGAVHWALTTLRYDVIGRRTIVYTDHRNLTYLMKTNSRKLIRWRTELEEYKFEVIHIPGKWNVEADYLSRAYTTAEEVEDV